MATFSWSDTFQIAFSSCLPCLSPSSPTDSSQSEEAHNPTAHRIPRARPDELHGLLLDPDTDTDAERMSLHSNLGRSKKRPKKRKEKRITLFGYDLFGRPVPGPIHLPESDDEEVHRPPRLGTRSSSTMTFDSDAAPLDTSIIENISTSTAAAAAAAVVAREEELRQKAERRAKRREKREQRRTAKMLEESFSADRNGNGDDFEGFQGSGDGFVHLPRAQVSLPPTYVVANEAGGDTEDDADLDGGVYTRTGREYGTSADSRSRSGGSDSRSRTSACRSDTSPRFLPRDDPQLGPKPKTASSHSTAPATSTPRSKNGKAKSKSSSRSAASRSTTSATTSQSASLASPTSSSFQFAPFPHPPRVLVPDLDADFDGSQGLTIDDLPPSFATQGGGGFSVQTVTDGFPSTGLGRRAEIGKGKESILAKGGAFLATRGGEVEAR